MTARRALVTGATGFVGAHLCSHLVAQGWEVTALCRPQSATEVLPTAGTAQVTRWHGGLPALSDILERTRPDVVFHLASLFLADHQPHQVESVIAANIEFGALLLEAMSCAGIGAFVNTGTFWQHYKGAPDRPVNLYAATKKAFEAVLGYYTDAHGLRAITLKLSDTYGPNDQRGKLVSLLLRLAREGGELAMSPGGQEVDLVHINDVTRAFAVAGERCLTLPKGAYENYSLSSGEILTLRSLVELFGELAGKRLSITWGGRPYRSREVLQIWRGGERLPGWEPQICLREGLGRLLRDL